jgi:hypothetical protein
MTLPAHVLWSALVALTLGCTSTGAVAAGGGAPNDGASADGSSADGGAHLGDGATSALDTGPRRTYPNGPPGCGLPNAAFCDTFDAPAASLDTRVAELDPSRWSGARMQPGLNPGNTAGVGGAATIGNCRAGLPATVSPGQDALVCDGNDSIQSAHLLLAAGEQSYGQFSIRTRRPFDFTGRTGTIVLDAELHAANSLQGWTSVSVTGDPSPAPSFAIQDNFENGATPRSGFEIHFFNQCGSSKETSGVSQVSVFSNFVERSFQNLGSLGSACVTATRGQLNHLEVRVSRNHLEVWGSDSSANGTTFGELRKLFELDEDLGLERGYVHVTNHNHSTLKYSEQTMDAWVARYDNIGFDGPVIDETSESSAPASLVPGTFDTGHGAVPGLSSGWSLRDEAETNGPEVALPFRGVTLAGATSASLALNWHVLVQPDIGNYKLLYRVNGGNWHVFALSGELRDHVTNPSTFLNGEELPDRTTIAGAMSLMADVPLSELNEGANSIEFATRDTPNSYRAYVSNVDLIVRR